MLLKTVNRRGTRLDKLKQLAIVLAGNIDKCEDPKLMPSLARQYRETIREIDDLEGGATDDEIEDILQQRQCDGKAGAVR